MKLNEFKNILNKSLGDKHISINYEDKELQNEFLKFPELEEVPQCLECFEYAREESNFCSDACLKDYKKNIEFDRDKEENN